MKTSIIILSYNKMEYTRQCIESIRKYTTSESFEIIVVDNNSKDGTVQWLDEQPDIKKILNSENVGFPKGCNQGIEVASGESILLLNNDTIVTHNWLSNLSNCLYSSEDVGCVGPVTNYCSYYQSIPAPYNTLAEMQAFAKNNNVADSSKWEDRLKLVGFCLLIKREVVEKVGLLDEIFTPGNFEDDDYCLRARMVGYRIVLCRDTFIHHFGSVSFGENVQKFSDALTLNKKKFEDKWNVSVDKLIEVRYDIATHVEASISNKLKILQIGCGGGGTLLAIKRKFAEAELYGAERDKNLLANLSIYANIVSEATEVLSPCYKDLSFDYIIFTDKGLSASMLVTYAKEFSKRLTDKGCFIFSLKKDNLDPESFTRTLMNSISSGDCMYYKFLDQMVVVIKNVCQTEKKVIVGNTVSLPLSTSKKSILNEKKICFICCVNDMNLFKKCHESINSLIYPSGFTIEVIMIEDSNGMAKAYTSAEYQCDAKYKIYLHQDVSIINKNFLKELLELFAKYPKLGMIGVVGAKTMPLSGVWWEASNKFGRVYESHTGSMELLQFEDVKEDYESVQCIDGLIMITQYDLPWREDLFTGWHFYDASQSLEFIKAGYDVGIPKQNEAWCVHDCGIVNVLNRYEEFKNIYLEEYSNLLFPKVSILIPTYNRPQFLELALKSALKQTYRNIEIIVCDDSSNDETEKTIFNYLEKNPHIKYIKNSSPNDALKNFDKCMSLSNGEYINYLMDDDLFHEDKIKLMAECLIQHTDVSLATSYRQLIDSNGDFLDSIPATTRLFDEKSFIKGQTLAAYMINNIVNIIGEPTSVLFRKKDMDISFGEYHSRRYYYNVDVAAWLYLLSKGNAVYFPQALSFLRSHDGNNPFKRIPLIINAAVEWFNLIEAFFNSEMKPTSSEYKDVLYLWLEKHLYTFSIIKSTDQCNKESLSNLLDCFDTVFRKLLIS